MEEDSPDLIWLGDKLPTIYKATIHTHCLSPTATAEIRDTVIHQYPSSLYDLWVPSFGSKYVKPYKTIPRILYQIMANMVSIVKHIFMEMQSQVYLANLFAELIEIGLTSK